MKTACIAIIRTPGVMPDLHHNARQNVGKRFCSHHPYFTSSHSNSTRFRQNTLQRTRSTPYCRCSKCFARTAALHRPDHRCLQSFSEVPYMCQKRSIPVSRRTAPCNKGLARQQDKRPLSSGRRSVLADFSGIIDTDWAHPCCDAHDLCFGECYPDFVQCNTKFHDCLERQCLALNIENALSLSRYDASPSAAGSAAPFTPPVKILPHASVPY